MILHIISLILMTVFSATAAVDAKALDKLTDRYKKAQLVEMDVEKSVVSELTGRRTKSTGKIFLMGELFRFDVNEPEKSQIIFDGKYLWTIQHPSADFGGEVSISRQLLKGKAKDQVFLTSLLIQGNTDKHFEVITNNADKEANVTDLRLKPKNNLLSMPFLDLRIDTAPGKNLVRSIKFEDEVANKTELHFPAVWFKNKKSPNLFKYAPPSGAKVVDL